MAQYSNTESIGRIGSIIPGRLRGLGLKVSGLGPRISGLMLDLVLARSFRSYFVKNAAYWTLADQTSMCAEFKDARRCRTVQMLRLIQCRRFRFWGRLSVPQSGVQKTT